MSVDSDLKAILSGFDSKTVTVGDWSGSGIVDEMDVLDQDRGGDPVLVRRTVLKLVRADFLDSTGALTVARGDSAIVDGISYTISDMRAGGADFGRSEEIDGRELHLVLKKV